MNNYQGQKKSRTVSVHRYYRLLDPKEVEAEEVQGKSQDQEKTVSVHRYRRLPGLQAPPDHDLAEAKAKPRAQDQWKTGSVHRYLRPPVLGAVAEEEAAEESDKSPALERIRPPPAGDSKSDTHSQYASPSWGKH